MPSTAIMFHENEECIWRSKNLFDNLFFSWSKNVRKLPIDCWRFWKLIVKCNDNVFGRFKQSNFNSIVRLVGKFRLYVKIRSNLVYQRQQLFDEFAVIPKSILFDSLKYKLVFEFPREFQLRYMYKITLVKNVAVQPGSFQQSFDKEL